MTQLHVNEISARPEDVLLAAVAYSRPEMLALDGIIAQHSRNSLNLNDNASTTALHSLPTELLLRIRAELQSSLLDSLAADTQVALDEYQSALVEGICPDCFWWHTDIYGPDLWAWIENGYRGACSCVVVGDVDPRTPSLTKKLVLKKYEGLDIGTRGQWLRAYIARTYLEPSTTAWRFARSVLAEFGCTHRFERTPVQPPSPHSPTTSLIESSAPGEVKKEPRRNTTCDFGALVRIEQGHQRRTAEDPAVTVGRMLRELNLKAPADDEPSIALQSSTTRFVDKIHRRAACETHFLAQRGSAANCFECLALFATPASLSSYAARSRSFSDALRSHNAFTRSPPFYSTLTSIAFGAASLAYLIARVVL